MDSNPLDTDSSALGGDETISSDAQPTITKIGKYRVTRKLGQGGMGEVWLGHHPDLDIPVAIKTLPTFLISRNKGYLDRFIKEARTAARINHANVVRIYDAGIDDDVNYIVMEFVDGGSVKELMVTGGTLDWRQSLDITICIAEALKAAAEFSIIHRDIKPDNIMLDKKGTPKLADLGLAKQTEGPDDLSVTAPGSAIGTPNYISPEQVQDAKTVDCRADIYSLGATFYHMATGGVPFSASSSFELMLKHVQEPLPPPKEKNPNLPDTVCAIICKMMAKRPEDRYQTSNDLLHDLNKVKHGKPKLKELLAGGLEPGATIPDGTNKTNAKMFIAAAVILLCLGLVAAGIKFWPRNGTPRNPDPDLPVVVENPEDVKPMLNPEAEEAKRNEEEAERKLLLAQQAAREAEKRAAFETAKAAEALKTAQEEARLREAEKKHAEEEAAAAEEAREQAEEDAKRATEEKTAALEAQKRAEEAVKREAVAKAAAEKARLAEKAARRKAEEKATRMAEEKARAEAEAKRVEEERKHAEAAALLAKQKAAEARRKAEAEAKRRAEEEADARRRVLERQRLAEEKAKAEAEAKRRAAAKARAVAKRRAEAEAKRLAAERAKAKAEAAKHKTFSNTPHPGEPHVVAEVKIPLVPIKAGTFEMGSRSTEWGRDADEIRHKTTISRDFWMGTHEITIGQFEAVTGRKLAEKPDTDNAPGPPANWDKLPAAPVSWVQAVAFCEELTAREQAAGRLPNGCVYRLPTEAEWEYACRAGNDGAFSFGNTNFLLSQYGVYHQRGVERPAAVGSKKPNKWGLYDMHGNVYEWCLDAVENRRNIVSTQTYKDGVRDPLATGGRFRASRGGSWRSKVTDCRAGARFAFQSTRPQPDQGFRVVLAPAVKQ